MFNVAPLVEKRHTSVYLSSLLPNTHPHPTRVCWQALMLSIRGGALTWRGDTHGAGRGATFKWATRGPRVLNHVFLPLFGANFVPHNFLLYYSVPANTARNTDLCTYHIASIFGTTGDEAKFCARIAYHIK